LSIVLWAVGLALIALVFLLGRSGGSVPSPVPLQNVQVGEDTDQALIQTASTPSLAVNPKDAKNYVIGYRVERPDFSCAVTASFDEGRNWEPAAFDLPPGAERCYTTSLGFDKDGTVHLAFVTLAGTNNVPVAAWVTDSNDGGRTFRPATKILDKDKFMVRSAVDPASSPAKVYVTWVEPSGIGLFQMAPPSAVMMMASSDGGATFGAPVRVSDSRRERVGAPVPVVGAGGALHVLYYDYRKDVFDFQNEPGRYEGDFELVTATSRDGGASFSESPVDGAVRPPEPFLVFTPPFPALAADPKDGRLYAAWSDGRAEKPAVLLSVSDDGGKKWSKPERVDDGLGDALLPQIGVAPDGRLDLAYVSVRDGEGRPTEIRLTSSADHGKTFGSAQALNRPFFRDLFPVSARQEAGRDLGSALAVASAKSAAFVAWPDTRRGGSDTLRADIVGAPVEVKSSGSKRKLIEIATR